jgi:putative copper export protein/mono/diheme cytochrome c family protein
VPGFPGQATAALVRGLVLLSLASATGGLTLGLLLPASAAPELDGVRARLRRWVTRSLLVLFVATGAELLVRTQAMSGASLAASVVAVPSVVAQTHLGQILAARLVALVVALLLAFEPSRAFRGFVLLVVVAAALSLSLSGHAADWGDATLSVAIDWAHAVAASVWVGGLIALALVAGRGAGWSRESLAAVVPRFSRLAGLCLAVVVVSGSYNAWAQLGGVSRLWETAYGRVLVAKLLIATVLVWLGAINRYTHLPRLAPSQAARGFGARAFRLSRLAILGPGHRTRSNPAESVLIAFVTREALVGLAVLACTAVLGEVTPGRHVQFERRPTTHVAPVSRSAGSGSRAGTVTPPRGDAAHGRAVFARLECGTCHATPDAQLSTPMPPGPDLAGLGARHPGEIVESIMNPNAQILDGPGYTDSHGQSTMPDYRDRLTVGELIDLVEYLRIFDTPPAAPAAPATPAPPAAPSAPASPPALPPAPAPSPAPATAQPEQPEQPAPTR